MLTRLTELLEVEHPIVQAPVGSAASPALAAAVSEAGGLGQIALSWTPPERVGDAVSAVRSVTGRPFAANIVLEYGQGVGLALRVQPAGAIVRELVEGAERRLRELVDY
jgi:nitronate monooxygenase